MFTMKQTLAWCFLLLPASVHAEETGWFPFVIPWDDAAKTATNVGSLNPVPAGKDGFLTIKDGHFFDGAGRRVRFLGTNLTFGANFPDKADAEKVAARLHKFGFNVVRLHHMDYFHAPSGIFDPTFKDKQHLDAGQLERLDYLVHQLKQHGIYVNVNLHVARAFTAADGFPETDRLPSLGKVVDFYEPRMIELQKKFARDLLGHRNRYTGKRYAEEPAVAVVEINNENTLLGEAWGETIAKLPPTYRAELGRQWNAWLKRRYRDTAGLRSAWAAADRSFGSNQIKNSQFTDETKSWTLEIHEGARATAQVGMVEPPEGAQGKAARFSVAMPGKQNWHLQFHQAGLDLADGEPYTVSFWARADRQRPVTVSAGLDQADWHQVGLNQKVNLGTEWRRFTLMFTASRTVKGHSRLSLILGDAPGTVDLADLALRQGIENPFPKDASLEGKTVPLGRPAANPAGQDWLAFLIETERHYLTTMRDYLKKDLGVRAAVVCSQASYGGLGGALRESLSDFTDMHSYWQHPQFPGRAWDPVDWRIGNTAMTRDSQGGTFPTLARYRLAGKPFTVSEYNHAAPNEYQAECVPLFAAFAAWQDWDGIYLFDYNSDRKGWNSDRIKGFFPIDSNPAKMALLPAAATLFLRADLAPAADEAHLRVPEGSVVRQMAKNGPRADNAWEAAGSPRLEVLSRRLALTFVPGQGEATLERSVRPNSREPGPKPLQWQAAGTDQAVFSVDAPASKVIVGFLSGQSVQLNGWGVRMSEAKFPFAALTLSALDGKPMEEARSLLLTAAARVENTDMRWNAERTSVGKGWGKGPTRAEGVRATITIRTKAGSATVHALDGAGKRVAKVESKLSGGELSFAINPDHKTLWYEVETSGPR